jgi:hypothetical protein
MAQLTCGVDELLFLYALRRAGVVVVVGSAPGPKGYPNSL